MEKKAAYQGLANESRSALFAAAWIAIKQPARAAAPTNHHCIGKPLRDCPVRRGPAGALRVFTTLIEMSKMTA